MARRKELSGSTIRPKVIAVAVAACFGMAPVASLANPTGPTVVSGSAAFAAQGNALTITNSHNAIINWQGFSIGVNELTRFLQPSVASAVLNRVIGAGGTIPQSVIDGILSSNGHVYLLNPNGIVFGPNAQIDVAGLVASSLDISNQDFLDGKLRFMAVPDAAGVANHGVIETASGGRVLLVAPNVENTGIIRSPQGEILLAAGKQVELVSEENPYVTVKLTADAGSALNVGSLISDSGRIGMYGGVVTNTGAAAANAAVVGEGGQIRLVATQDVTVAAGSTVTANGERGGDVLLQARGGTARVEGSVEAKGTSGSGGTVDALGVRVGVLGSGVIDASGETGGGTVRVGGDYQGKNAEVQNAQETTIGSDGVIRADAGSSGDGGRVIVWADGSTAVLGSVSAQGGAQSGDGGFVETSGKRSLTVAGARVDASAPNGSAGGWLLDPTDYTIDAAQAAAIQSNFGSVGYVQVVADGNIDYQSGLSLSYSSGGGLYENYASNNINLNANTISTNQASVYLEANSSYGGSPSGSGAITSTMPAGSTQIRTGGGNVDLMGSSVTVAGIDTSTTTPGGWGGDVAIGASNSVATGAIATRGAPGQAATSTQAGGEGGWGGDVFIYALSVGTGAIDTSGGPGAAGYSGPVSTAYGNVGRGGWGGWGGDIDIDAGGVATINTGPLTARGGSGGNGGSVSVDATGASGAYVSADGGGGGLGGYVYLSSNGAVTVNGTTDLSGGRGGAGGNASISGDYNVAGVSAFRQAYANGGDGGSGGAIDIYGSAISTGQIIARSGNGGAGGSASVVSTEAGGATVYAEATGGSGSDDYYAGGGWAYLWASGPVTVAGIDTSGGNGGIGGSVAVATNGGGTITRNVDVTGGDGGQGFPTDAPQPGLAVYIGSDSAIVSGNISTRGGNGGQVGTVALSGTSSGDNIDRSGVHGGDGGSVYLDGASVSTGVVTTRGGNGAPGGAGGEGGSGGHGGDTALIASGVIEVGPEAKPGVFATVIDASGGSGGAGGPPASPAPPGGEGGFAGFVNLDGSTINVNGIILAAGGVGGAGFDGGPGGDGGHLTLATAGSAGIITFYNGGWDILGGAAGPGAFGGLAGLAGKAGVVDVFGTLVFVILDPLLIPEIQAAIQQTIDSSDKSIPNFEEPNGDEDEEDKLRKKGTAVCKPRSS